MAHISTSDLSRMCTRVGTSLQAGVDVMTVLNREASSGRGAYRSNMTRVSESVGRGAGLADGMKACQGYFPPLMCELVDVGEQTGRLESVLLRLADHYRHLIELRRVFLFGIIWPALQLAFAILAIGLLIFILGILGTSTTVFGLSGPRGLAIYFLIVTGVILTVAAVIWGLMRGWFGDLPSRLVMRLPVVGGAIKTMSLSRLTWTLSMALNAGIDARRAVRMSLQSTQNGFYTRHIEEAEKVIAGGGQFHDAFRSTGAFQEDFLTALENSEISGTESESLTRLSADYGKQAKSSTTALAVAASMVIWGLVVALLVFMIFHMFMNLYMKPINEALEMVS
jgi:type II secretory pathway component PulF